MRSVKSQSVQHRFVSITFKSFCCALSLFRFLSVCILSDRFILLMCVFLVRLLQSNSSSSSNTQSAAAAAVTAVSSAHRRSDSNFFPAHKTAFSLSTEASARARTFGCFLVRWSGERARAHVTAHTYRTSTLWQCLLYFSVRCCVSVRVSYVSYDRSFVRSFVIFVFALGEETEKQKERESRKRNEIQCFKHFGVLAYI